MADPFRLDRFVAAQDPVYAAAVAELRAGRKRTHWMWFIFPQLAGLGHSDGAIEDIFGHPDDLKFRSSMTLFARAAPGDPTFAALLRRP